MVEFFDEDMLPTLSLTGKKGLAGTGKLMAGDRFHDVNLMRLDLNYIHFHISPNLLRIARKILLVSQELDS